MIFHENRLPADDSHEISCLIGYFWKGGKIWNCRLLQIIGGALWVKVYNCARYAIYVFISWILCIFNAVISYCLLAKFPQHTNTIWTMTSTLNSGEQLSALWPPCFITCISVEIVAIIFTITIEIFQKPWTLSLMVFFCLFCCCFLLLLLFFLLCFVWFCSFVRSFVRSFVHAFVCLSICFDEMSLMNTV